MRTTLRPPFDACNTADHDHQRCCAPHRKTLRMRMQLCAIAGFSTLGAVLTAPLRYPSAVFSALCNASTVSGFTRYPSNGESSSSERSVIPATAKMQACWDAPDPRTCRHKSRPSASGSEIEEYDIEMHVHLSTQSRSRHRMRPPLRNPNWSKAAHASADSW